LAIIKAATLLVYFPPFKTATSKVKKYPAQFYIKDFNKNKALFKKM